MLLRTSFCHRRDDCEGESRLDLIGRLSTDSVVSSEAMNAVNSNTRRNLPDGYI